MKTLTFLAATLAIALAAATGGTTEHPTDDHANADAGTRSHDNADAASVT